jgi:DNA-binding MarR family transcriptional regulator
MSKIEDVLVALRRVIRATDLHSKQLIKTASVTAPQLLLMQAINRHGDVMIGKLAKEVSLSQATVTTILDRLEKRELVYRQRSDQDKRRVHARLTDKGCAILQAAPTALQDRFVKNFTDLEDWEQTLMLATLQRLAHMMDAQDLDASPVLDVGALDHSDNQQINEGADIAADI